jgi:hypothetical protein
VSETAVNRDQDSCGGHPGAAPGAAAWLSLAATPSFALMALLTKMTDDGPTGVLCSAAHGAPPLGGMTSMYVLMSIFHCTPWGRLMVRWQALSRRPSADIQRNPGSGCSFSTASTTSWASSVSLSSRPT